MREGIHLWLSTQLGVELPIWLIPNQTMWIALGFLVCAVLGIWSAKREGLSVRRSTLGIAFALVGAVVGSRLLGIAVRPDIWFSDPLRLLDPRWAGALSFGAFLGAIGAFLLYARRARFSIWPYADAWVPVAAIGLFFARIGCFVKGCDFGRMSSVPWALRYPKGSPAFQAQLKAGFVGPYQLESLPVHPLQLYLAGVDLIVGVAFLFWLRPGSNAGDRGLLTAAAYFGGRFVVEFWRSPYASPMFGFLNLAQWFCVTGLVMIYIAWGRRVGARGLA